jgi:hypothetical protein
MAAAPLPPRRLSENPNDLSLGICIREPLVGRLFFDTQEVQKGVREPSIFASEQRLSSPSLRADGLLKTPASARKADVGYAQVRSGLRTLRRRAQMAQKVKMEYLRF